MSGGIVVIVDHGAWSVTVPESTALTGVFGPLTIRAWGFIRSNGEFDVNLSASVHLGVDGFSISGTLSAGASLYIESGGYHFRFFVRGEVEVELFGIGIGGSIELSGEAFLGASNSFLRLRLTACVDLFFFDACGSTTIAEIQLPNSIFPQQPPKLAQYQTGDSGALELNVGALASRRTVVPTTTAEDYRVTQVSFDATTGYYTVRVEAFGYSEVFSRVTRITGDFGSDNDTFVLVTGAGVPVTINGGAGNDILSSQGSGLATLNGNDGNDTLIGGSGADTLNGGDQDDYLDGRGGLDTMQGGAGNDILYGTLVNVLGETLLGGAGTDIVEIGGTNSADHFVLSVGASNRLQVSTTGGLTGAVTIDSAEDVRISPRGGADTVTLNGALNATGLQTIKLVMSGEGGTDGADLITMNLLDTVDSVDVTGQQTAAIASVFRGDGVTGVDYGFATATPVPTTTIAWSGHYSVVVSDSGASNLDLLTIAAAGGADTVQVKSLASNMRIEGGDGDDRISVGSSATATTNTGGTLEGIDAALNVVGGAPTASDVLLIDDSGDSDGETGQVTSSVITGWGLAPAGITYSEVETVTITLGSGADTANVLSTVAGATTTINAGGGADTFRLSS